MNASLERDHTAPRADAAPDTTGRTAVRPCEGGSAPAGTLLRHPASSRRRTSTPVERASTARRGLAPARVDLVERFDTGKLYLRAFIDGHFFWQPVGGADDSIPDSGAWMTGRAFHDVYWINHGAYRRRAGCYHPVDRAIAVRRAV